MVPHFICYLGNQVMASTEDLRVTSNLLFRERSGSVVECLTRDRGAALGSSLTSVTVLCH